MDPPEKFEKIELTVIGVQGLRPSICSSLGKVHLEISGGARVQKTTPARGMAPHVWNEKFNFELADSQELSLSLYKTRPFGQPVLIGSLAIAVDLEARNQDLSKPFHSTTKGRPITVTYRLREPERNFRDPRCPIFALIIGIDQYLSNAIPNLRGCVNDAQTIRTFLTNKFHIPEPQIAFLADEGATREHILETFRTHLLENSSIEKDDTIILYYAGHGSRAKAPESWPSPDGKIETLVPHDERAQNEQGETIHGIPDRTINALLSQLATAKGNNITVILDCCHSGGATRGSAPSILPVPRFVETDLPIPENLDQTLWGGRSGHVDLPPGISHKFMHSHVLLAACRQQQRARECISAAGKPCGFFTDALIKELRGIGPNRVTYADLLELLPTLPDQHPQCEGAHKDRFIFDIGSPRHDPKTCALVLKEDGTLEVDIGTLHGVVVGTQFIPESDTRRKKEPDRVLVAVSVNLDSSILIPIVPMKDSAFPEGTRLVVSDWKNEATMMKVYVYTSEDLPLATSDLSVQRLRPGFLVVESLNNADLAVRRASEEEISLTRLDARISRYVMQDVKLTVPIRNLPYVLDAVAQFNYFLGRHNGSDPLGSEVKLEMYNLSGEYGFRVPNPEVGNLVVDNEVRFQLDTQAKYGFAISNYSQHDLFPYLFYFDPATYSIDAWFLPESRTMSAPLPAKSGSEPTRVTVGYGAGGGYAFQFVIPPGITSDTGFLKVFLSTKYLDLKWIEQAPAVDAVVGGRDSQVEPFTTDAEIWGALDVPITIFTEDSEGSQ
ncbi:caspase domain-containing protein [Mycena maculata]|uniref:Caspase domain-containing protein n=1 Tax=Mycena maculata TaxID=230809 RepID=A0AAD7JVU1_9AGAR|nr:caspase domain-containing protein [Mycena maculata]